MLNTTYMDQKLPQKNSSIWLVGIASLLLVNLPVLFTLAIALALPSQGDNEVTELQHILNAFTFIMSPLLIIWLIAQQQGLQWRQCLDFLGLNQIMPKKVIIRSVGVGLLITLISMMLATILQLKTEQTALTLISHHQSLAGIISLVIMVTIASPALEEIVFRGWFWQAASKTKLGSFGAALVTSIIFTAMHVTPTSQSVSLLCIFSVAMIAAWQRFHYQSLWPAIVMHATFNGSQLLGLLFMTSL